MHSNMVALTKSRENWLWRNVQLRKVWQEEILHLESSRICKIRFCKKFIALSAKLCKAHTDTTKLAVLERNTLKRSRKRDGRLKDTIGTQKKKENILFSSCRHKSSWGHNGNPHLISEQLWVGKNLKFVENLWIGKWIGLRNFFFSKHRFATKQTISKGWIGSRSPQKKIWSQIDFSVSASPLSKKYKKGRDDSW